MEYRSLSGLARLVAALGCFSGAAACSSVATTNTDPEESVETEAIGTVQQAINGAFSHDYVTYGSTESFTTWPADQQFCMMSGVRGDGVMFRLTGGNGNGWKAVTDADTAGWVLCFPVDNFRGRAGSAHGISRDANECDTYQNRNCWWGDAATFIRRVDGGFYGGGEYVRTFQSTSATSPSTIVPYASTGIVQGSGKSIFFGVPGGIRLVRLMGYSTSGAHARGTVLSSGTFLMSVSTYSGYGSYWLSPTDAAVCGFTKVGGAFEGGAEIARISPSEGHWFLSSSAVSGDVWASARCMAWDQT